MPKCSNKVYELVDLKIPKPEKISQQLKVNLYLNKKITQFSTFKDQKKKRITNPKLPSGFKIFDANIGYQNSEIYSVVDKMVDNYRDYLENKYGSEFKRGLPTTFRNILGGKELGKTNNFTKIMEITSEIDPSFNKILMKYFNKVMKVVKVSKNSPLYKSLLEDTTLDILRYEGDDPGLECHQDNFKMPKSSRNIQSNFIVTIGLGQNYYYDLIPLMFEESEIKDRKPIRIRMCGNQGSIMDGEVRYAWQHCVPYGYITGRKKITILLKIPSFRKNKPVYNKFLDKKITQSI